MARRAHFRIGCGYNHAGFALPMVLWVTLAIGMVATAAISVGREHTRWVRTTILESKARAVAEGGAWLGIFSAYSGEDQQGGLSRDFEIGEGIAHITVAPEGSRVDLNRARLDVLTLLIGQAVDASNEVQSLAEAILDWRDPDDIKREFGAERRQYRAAGYHYGPKNGPFNAVEELRLVIGVTESIYQKLAPMITVYSHSSLITPDANDGFSEAASVTLDDSMALGDRAVNKRRVFGHAGQNVLRIISDGKVGDTVVKITTIVEIDQNATVPYRVLSWKEG